jgi:hypothetical protein
VEHEALPAKPSYDCMFDLVFQQLDLLAGMRTRLHSTHTTACTVWMVTALTNLFDDPQTQSYERETESYNRIIKQL